MKSLREDFNKHLTNNVIIRLDYVPLPDDKVDSINNKIAEMLLVENNFFSDTKQTLMRNIDIQMNDPSIQDFNEFINVKEKSKIKSYEYYKYNENKDIEIKLVFNRQFCAIDINQIVKYYKFEYYRDIFLKVLNIIIDNKVIINRFGLRKFNDFFLKQYSKIDEYVKEKYFNLECDDLLESSDSFISEKRYTFARGDENVNLITHSSIGTMDNDVVKRVAFDIDIYVTDIKKLNDVFSNNNTEFINGINNLLFDIYLNLLTDKMIDILKKENDLNDENIICGVDYNENN